ncbi:tetratricopeptide repeat protein [Terrarubrum flagellatum]|uniref:tetratricopeptide repeat protein n=1 Tax=Terrirubrum flagellatum TaxID=2895980 RepID=UPI0031456D44
MAEPFSTATALKIAGITGTALKIAGKGLEKIGLDDASDLLKKIGGFDAGTGDPVLDSFIARARERAEEVLARQPSSPRDRNPEAVEADKTQALLAFDEALPKVLIAPGDFPKAGLDHERAADLVLGKLCDIDPVFREDSFNPQAHAIARTILVDAFSFAFNNRAFMETLDPCIQRVVFQQLERIEDKINTGKLDDERRHQEILAAIARDKGVDVRVLEPLFKAAELDPLVPHDQVEAHVRAAIDILVERGKTRLAPDNLGAEIETAIREAREKLVEADAAGAIRVLDKQLEAEAESRNHRARGEARLWIEKADIFAGTFNRQEAIRALKQARKLDASNFYAAAREGDLERELGRTPLALAAFRRAGKIASSNADERHLSVSHNKIGDILSTQGDLDAALAEFHKGLVIAEQLTQRDPANTPWRRDLSVSHSKIGDILSAQGDLDAALAEFRKSLAITEQLAQHDPANTQWRRDLSVCHERIGDILSAQGDLDAALAEFRKALAIREQLAQRDPANTPWRRDLSVSHNKIGDILSAQGDLDAALAELRKALFIRKQLAQRDPANTLWRRDLSVSHNLIGDILSMQGDLDAALAEFHKGLAIAEQLTQRDPANTEWRRDLIVSYVKLSETDLSNAAAWLDKALAVARDVQKRGVLAPQDAWMPAELEKRRRALD